MVVDDSAPLTLDELRERYPDLPEHLTPEASRQVFGQLKPGKTVLENNRTYETIDALLQSTPGAIKSQFFKAAQEVTSWNGLGSLDGANFINDASEDALNHVTHGLVAHNLENANLLLNGKTPPGMEGLRGKMLDYAMVQNEQKMVQSLLDDYFKQHPEADREAIERDLSFTTMGKTDWENMSVDEFSEALGYGATGLFSATRNDYSQSAANRNPG